MTHVPYGVPGHFREQIGHRGEKLRIAWKKLFAGYRKHYPDLAKQLE